jgi:hypothetical protein
MGVVQDDGPVLLGDEPEVAFHQRRIAGQDLSLGPGTTVDAGPGAGGIVEDTQDPRMRQRLPYRFVTLARAPQADWEAQMVPMEMGHDS